MLTVSNFFFYGKSAKEIFLKRCQKPGFKVNFYQMPSNLSVFDFDIQYIKRENNYLPNFLTREYLQEKTTNIQQNIQDK